tara:strand:+ start:471 stop:1145 length:675 start_codon:yes stop_codon:yes gene_type:complete
MSWTLATLKTAVQNYTENDETTFVSSLNTFILMAEERLLKEVQFDVFRKNVSGKVSINNKFLTKPTDFMAVFSLALKNGSDTIAGTDITGYVPLLQKHPTYIADYNPTDSDTGVPKYYASFDDGTFVLGPTPNDNYASEMHYFYRPNSLTVGGDSGTTWLSINAPLALLYSTLVEAYTFMKGEPQIIQLYNERYIEALGRLKNMAEGLDRQDQYRYGSLRQAVS